jgi:hypothetical protein
MEHLELDEPAITTTLCALQQSGWVKFLGTRDGVDWWRPGTNGQRLLATVLLKRISRAQAQEILAQLIEETGAINADVAISSRIKQIVLFGSRLTGLPEDTVGVQAYLASRGLLPNEQRRGPIHASLKDTVLAITAVNMQIL